MKTERSCLWWLCLISGIATIPAITLWLWEFIFYDEDEEGE